MVKTLGFPATPPRHLSLRLDATRISGISSAIALHLVALGLLMMPARTPMPTDAVGPRIRVEPLFEPLPPPPPPPPIQVEVVQRKPIRPATRPTPARLPTATASQPVASNIDIAVIEAPAIIVDHGDPAPALPAGGDITPADSGPLAGIALQYLLKPKPSYPREALQAGMQGTVLLRVTVDEKGRPVDVQVEKSSGHRLLDRAAREQVLRRWSFVPAQRNGVAVKAVGTVPVDFRID